MKLKIFAASLLIAGASISSFAQGYKDGIEYYKVDQLDNAKELLERNLSSASNKAEAFYYLGQIALHQGDAATAQSYFDKGVAADANFPLNYVGQGQLALKNGAKPAQFDAARKLSKKDSKLETAIARAYYDVNPTKYASEIEKCIKNARKWHANDPDSYIFEGDTYADLKDWGKSAGQYELAFTNDPDNVEAYVKYANTYFNVNPSMALERLEELNAKRPNSALVQRQLAEKYYSDNQGGKAAEKYGEYIQNPNHFAQDEVRYVQLLFFGENYQKSYDLASSLINKLDKNDPKVFFMQRMKLYNDVQLEQWDKAVIDGKAFFAMPQPADADYQSRDYTDYAQALQKVGNAEEAIAAYEKAIEINPKNYDLMRNLSDSYADAKNYDKAIEYIKRVVEGEDSKANDIYTLGNCYYSMAVDATDANVKSAAIENARKYLTEVNEKVPGNVLIVNKMARLEKLSEGENITGKAAPYFKELVKILDAKEDNSGYDSYYVSAFNYLANYELTCNKNEAAAKEYYKKWLDHDQNNEDLRKYVNSLK
ncbi:MAG: tetratricopeptide repeat protein [Bacteroidales bacterium]|nr:tetratricopeptide repeat protein [Candidatus Sodaliphilus aphodohippi]